MKRKGDMVLCHTIAPPCIYRVSGNLWAIEQLEIVDIKICLLSQICPSKMLEVKEIQGVESEN